ncbi:anhydro-N-acetylmuramic acid kinase [Ferrimonas lipolytica]|uniref:Anhydro-N-acetylmuramic acid kinase n=1 Tax=Ferrimonas lipolytica TaxID=2724191 RepID=A0A6H1UFL8_9GAMM|nr:anhydro-N-acetylmuramic acid kinase [Ferrimonas lipolytica]QIZ77618.1 anhydro-N-acetylmuramic acid kinase [Ferrimonas lipolytica]
MTYLIGLMSGTSMDGVDAALVQFDDHGQPTLLEQHTLELPAPLLIELHRLCRPGNDEIDRLGRADRALAQVFAEACHNLLAKTKLNASDISAIGSHGQTVRHMPDGHHAFTLQLGCPNTLAALTGIDVIADFRRKDIALGGQGAPLVPAFHQALFRSNADRAIVNIGGISNITWLPSDGSEVLGYDTGPGNTLMDAWCRDHLNCSYDKDGALAASGLVNDALLERLLSHPYFSQPAPKSTGRELFNSVWLQGHLHSLPAMADNDILATLLATTVISICDCISHHSNHTEVYLCGGGAFNAELVRQMRQRLPHSNVRSTEALGLDPQWVESTAFAWLAYRHINGLSGNLPAVTGASREAILGGFYPSG